MIMTIDEIRKPVIPLVMVYNRRITKTGELHNLESNMLLREQMEFKDMIPIPNYFVQMMRHFGRSPDESLLTFLCQHLKFPPAYPDIYPENSNDIVGPEHSKIHNIRLLEVERDGQPLRHRSVRVKPELNMLNTACISAQRMLLGSSMLPRPVVEFYLEQVFEVNSDSI